MWNIVTMKHRKRTGRDPKGNIMILPPVSVEEHIAVQRETKARTILLQSLPEDHMADFHHLDDARDIWLAVKARFGVMILSQLNQMQAKPDNEDCNMKFLKALLPSWSQVAITLKTKGGGSVMIQEVQSAPTHSAFISAASTNLKMSYPEQSHSTTFTSASSSPAASSNELDKTEETIGPCCFVEFNVKIWSNHKVKMWKMVLGCLERDYYWSREDATGNATGTATGDVADDSL
ncbi:hypothetical protein Tco_1185028 [Tanacetum coccineum]